MQLPQQLIDDITLENLLAAHKELKEPNKCSIPRFSYDARDEKRLTNKLIRSFEEVIRYYGGKL